MTVKTVGNIFLSKPDICGKKLYLQKQEILIHMSYVIMKFRNPYCELVTGFITFC